MIRVLSLSGEAAGVRPESITARLLERGVEVVHASPSIAREGGSRWRSYLAARRMVGFRNDFDPHLVHAHGFASADLAVEIAEQWSRPYVLTADRFLLPGQSVRISRRWIRGVIASEDELAIDLVKGLGIPERWVSVIPPGIEVAAPWMPRTGSRVAVIGTAVGTSFGSGLATFLEAAQRVVRTGLDVEFVLADLDGSSAFARRLAEGLGVVGQVTITEASDLEHTFWPVLDLYCHPLRWPCPSQRLAEAMARGLPTIASDLPVLRALSDNGRAGKLVPPGDPFALAATMTELLQDLQGAQDLGRAARQWIVKHRSLDLEADAVARLYHQAVAPDAEFTTPHRADRARASVTMRRS